MSRRRIRRAGAWFASVAALALCGSPGCGGGGPADAGRDGREDGPPATDRPVDRASGDAANTDLPPDAVADLAPDAAADLAPDAGAPDAGAPDAGAPDVGPLPPSVALSPETCAASWHVFYSPEATERPPARPDMSFRDSTLFVAHSGNEYSWVFSMPARGGPKNLLYEGRLRSFWLEDQRLLYAQDYDLFDMPVGGGPPTNVLRYGGAPYFSPQYGSELINRQLDREAIYWLHSDISGMRVQKHLRAGGDDVTLASLTSEDLRARGLGGFVEAVGDQLLVAYGSDLREPLAVTFAKRDGSRRDLPAPPAHDAFKPSTAGYVIPLGVSRSGTLLWSRPEPQAGTPGGPPYGYFRGAIDGTAPSRFESQIEPRAAPLIAWPVGDGSWYVGASEQSPQQAEARYLSIWIVTREGAAARLACDPVVRTYNYAPANVRAEVSFASGVAGDGRLYVSVVRPDKTWVVAAVDNPGFPGETRDTGPPRGDGGVADGAVGDGGGPDAGCPASALGVDSGGHALAEFPIPSPKSGPQYIVAGPDKNLWFNEVQTQKLGRVSTSGCITELPIAGYTAYAADVAAGPDGNIWMTQSGIDRIGRIEPSGMFLREFPMALGATGPRRIIPGPDGNLWYTQSSPSAVARITVDGVVTTYPTPFSLSQPMDLLVGPDGNIWFAESNSPKLGRIEPNTGVITEFPLGGQGVHLANASDGNIWVGTLSGAGQWKMMKVSMAGVATYVPLPYSGAYGPMTKGPDGNLWFTEPPVGRVARLVPTTLDLTEIPTSSPDSDPRGITVGPDGNLWFVESGAGKIGRLSP